MDFGIAKFRIAKFSHCEFDIAKFSHCEIGIGIAKSILALRNWNWHCEMDFGIAKFRIAKFSHCEFGLRNFRIAKLVCEIFALRNWFANSLRNFCFADFPCFSSCLQLHLILSTFPLIFH